METDREVADFTPDSALNSKSSIKCPTKDNKGDTWETKAAAVLQLLNEDIKAADLKWSLFIAASDSFRHETCLKPFPPKYSNDGTKDFDSLMNVIAKTESFGLLLEYLKDPSYIASHKEVVDLLHYILVILREPYLKSVRPEEYDAVLKKVPSEAEACRPQYIFEVVSTPTSQSENRWKSLSRSKNTFYAYHGSKLENFHSIIHHGLQQHLNKNLQNVLELSKRKNTFPCSLDSWLMKSETNSVNVFGTGIYLSSELSVSLHYSPVGLAWGSSNFGPELSCLAMCQLIQTEGIYCQKTAESKTMEQIQCRVRDSKAGEVPLKYFVVANNELVKLRYLLLYSKEPPSLASLLRRRDSPMRRWFSQHKLLTMLFGYSFMLATIGLANNNQMQYYYRVLVKKIETAIKGLKF